MLKYSYFLSFIREDNGVKKINMRKSLALVLISAMLMSFCSCTSTETQNKDTQNEHSQTTMYTENIVEKHNFENGVCKDCGKDWTTCLYEALCVSNGEVPTGHYRERVFAVENGIGDGDTIEITSDGKSFMIHYKTSVVNDICMSYELRFHEDPFGEVEGTMLFDVDFAVYTHYGKFPEYDDMAQICLSTNYCCKPEDLMNAYTNGEIFTGENAFSARYYESLDDVKYYFQGSAGNDMTVEEMFGNSECIDQEKFNAMYLANYMQFQNSINEVLAYYNMSLSDFGIK